MKNQNKKLTNNSAAKLAAGFAVLSLLGASASAQEDKGGQYDPWIITVTWASETSCEITNVKAETNSCNMAEEDICLGRGKYLQWQSSPENIDFDIFFGPVRDAKVKGNNGKAKSKIEEDAPFITYKYSILKRGCDPETDVLDPRIRVNK